ncbi:lysine N(6)-hydroxylase/L-ornithine N(5)-oxygenase family protein [Halostagnicola larsenii]|uniref:lysine N(6)-hydroxylase/L-ornithine N(5)-oxygenase family protein n=1 Tax=Halostagnicola larsenii TaxID=353800 RepID=UPI0006788A3A|nr:lysine N(6)-hydroxylase/L-ornithine N(5)-oxygenase family protein [Halostagnicola larsenii]
MVGIGLGPFDLGLAALIEGHDEIDLDAIFLEQKPSFSWHEGMLIEDATLEVPFLADVVTLADPTSPYSYLNYLEETDRLYEFYFYETFQTPRREYDAYCRWVAERLESPRFSRRVIDVRPVDHPTANFQVTAIRPDDVAAEDEVVSGTDRDVAGGNRTEPTSVDEPVDAARGTEREQFTYLTRDLVVGVGSKPFVPAEFRGFPDDSVFHTARYRYNRSNALDVDSIAVIGSGQSAAEVFQDLLARQPNHEYRLDWVTRSDGFFPMEYSKLGLQHFAPEYVEYVTELPQPVRDDLIPEQELLYKGIDPDTSDEIYEELYRRSVGGDRPDVGLIAMTEVRDIDRTEAGRYRLDCRQWQSETTFSFEPSVVILGTGYHRPTPPFLDGIDQRIHRDDRGRLEITREYTLKTDLDGTVFVQNAGLHTHGVGTPDLGLGTYRNVVILDQLLEESPYSIPTDTVYQDFSPASFVRNAPGGSLGGTEPLERMSDSDRPTGE